MVVRDPGEENNNGKPATNDLSAITRSGLLAPTLPQPHGDVAVTTVRAESPTVPWSTISLPLIFPPPAATMDRAAGIAGRLIVTPVPEDTLVEEMVVWPCRLKVRFEVVRLI